MGFLITFEGIEGCGKTTQLAMIERVAADLPVHYLFTVEPGGTPLGIKIRELLLNRNTIIISGEAELLLFTAARIQHMQDVIIPALDAGKIVFCDRFTDATLAYQGHGRKLDLSLIATINTFATAGRSPDLTILFDIPPEIGLKRAKARISGHRNGQSAEDRFEQEDMAFHQAIREGYLSLAGKEPQRFRIIDASRAVEAIHLDVLGILLPWLESKKNGSSRN
ncbi:MAG: dTMP kinase [Syntrophales bacterium]|jgi:dTMP kinase